MRLDAPEVLAGASPAGLDLVGDEQDAVFVEDFLVRLEQTVGRHGESADTLDRLGDQRADVLRVDRGLSSAQVGDAGVDVLGVGEVAELGQRLSVPCT